MITKFHFFSTLLEHSLQIDKFKYKLIIYTITAVHIFLVGLFGFLRIYPLIIFNIGSVITYISCVNIIKYGYEKDLIRTFYITYVEIIVHSFVATICVGWRFGFPQYTIGLIPFGYYMCVTLIEDPKKKYFVPTVLGLMAFLSFVGCRTISMFTGPVFQLDVTPAMELIIYIFNTSCNFGFLFLVTLVFVIDMQTAANLLRSQNLVLGNMASIDPLTGLYNRRSMQDFFEAVVKAEENFCLIMCDIDNFKKVNDTYGHDFGDVVLKEISQIIRNQVSDHGHVCRWGGEEILIMAKVPLDQTCQIAENIRSNVEEHLFVWRETAIHCSLTLGVAAHKIGDAVENTITHADKRLYYGKKNGRNRVVSSFDAP
ncbi:MAG: GGDEF domain-containing protein [Blautia sp.]|nr:GGDEF domain-containing protein [Blautia sp.]MCM1200510.1 GGDEF domain-containing protein [Bacteroides fragilis]